MHPLSPAVQKTAKCLAIIYTAIDIAFISPIGDV
mgnify:CR=1 FL=1|jgi:hypothetical protein